MGAMDLSLGAIVVSALISFLSMGINLTLTWIYVARYPNDNWTTKLLVLSCLILTMTDTAAGGYWCYNATVTHFDDPSNLLEMPWSFAMQVAILGFVSLFVQLFYAWRIWIITMKRNWWLPGLIVSCSLLGWCILMWVTSILATHTLIAETGIIIPTVYFWLAGSIAADFFITMGLFYYLYFRYTKDKLHIHMRSIRSLKAIILRTVQCNVLSLFAQVATTVLFKTRVGYYYYLPDFIMSKIYFFSLLVSLVSRQPHEPETERSISLPIRQQFRIDVRSEVDVVNDGVRDDESTLGMEKTELPEQHQ